MDRLTSVTGYKANTYTYDEVGNRKSQIKSGSTETYNYSGSSNQLVSVGGSSISYNANGQTQSKLGSSFIYNDENRLSQHTKSGQSTTYSYNAFGQRANKTNSTSTTRFFYDEAGKLIAEYSVDDNKWKEYIYLHGQVVGFAVNGALYYVHNDHLGRAERITNASKSTVWRANNHDFDRVVAQDSIGGYNLGFPGQYYDSEKDSYYNYFRDYDPKMGRYIQSDPIGLAGGINTYGYVGGNPVGYMDPLGLAEIPTECVCHNSKSPTKVDSVDVDFHNITEQQAHELNRDANNTLSLKVGAYSTAVAGYVGYFHRPAGYGLEVIGLGASYFASPSQVYSSGMSRVTYNISHEHHKFSVTQLTDKDGNLLNQTMQTNCGGY